MDIITKEGETPKSPRFQHLPTRLYRFIKKSFQQNPHRQPHILVYHHIPGRPVTGRLPHGSPFRLRTVADNSPCLTRGRKRTGGIKRYYRIRSVPLRSRVKHGNGIAQLFL